jgi:hypothetical protein
MLLLWVVISAGLLAAALVLNRPGLAARLATRRERCPVTLRYERQG